MLLLVIFHMICVWIQLKYKLLNYRWFIGLFIASIIGFCIVYFAPGNKIREAYFIGESHRFLYSLVHTCLQIIRFIFEWFSSGVLILLSLVYLAIYPYIEKQVFAIINFLHLNKWISLCSLLGVLFISIFPAYWSTGMMGQHRTVNSAYFYFLFLWFINLTLWRNTKFIQKIIVNKRIINYSLIAVIVLLGCSNNSYYVWKDLFTQNASSFDKEMNKRYELLNNFSKQSDALRYLPVLTSKPSSIYVYDIRKDPKYFPNTCYKSYWKLNSYIVGK